MSKPKKATKREVGRPLTGPEPLKSRTFREGDTAWDKCHALGGGAFLRKAIADAPDPRIKLKGNK